MNPKETWARSSADIGDLAAALAQAQAKFKTIKRTELADMDRYKFKFAPLHVVIESVRKPLAENELALSQLIGASDDSIVRVETLLIHSSGQWLRSVTTFKINDNASVRDLGAVTTYLRRYAEQAMLNVATQDDDDDASSTDAPAAASEDDEPLSEHPTEMKMLMLVAEENADAWGGKSPEEILESLAVKRFRIEDGDWTKLKKSLLNIAIKALRTRAAELRADKKES